MTVWFRPRDGQFGFIMMGWWLHIKATWCAPLFSGRYGYAKWRKLGAGWRFQFRRMVDQGK